MNLSDKSSNVINALKCILCIGVVFVHGQINVGEAQLLGTGSWSGQMADYSHFTLFQELFANLFCDHVCVPIFFILSGFLFFLKMPDAFDIKWFGKKYKSRVKSLLVPYLIANAFFIIAMVAFDVYRGNTDFDLWNLLKGFWTKEGRLPADPPLWFMRDLLVAIIFSPLIYISIKWLSWFIPFLFGIWWIVGVPNAPEIGFSVKSFFFVSTGAWFAIKGIDFIEKLRSDWSILIFWAVYVVCIYLYKHYDAEWLLRLSVIAGCPAMIATIKLLANLAKPCPHAFVVCTVFTYMYHYFVPQLLWRLLVIPLGTSESSIFVAFFLGVALTIVGFYFTYILLNKLFPKITSVIVGGR